MSKRVVFKNLEEIWKKGFSDLMKSARFLNVLYHDPQTEPDLLPYLSEKVKRTQFYIKPQRTLPNQAF